MKHTLAEFYADNCAPNFPLEQRIQLFNNILRKNCADKAGGHSYDLVYAALFNNLNAVQHVGELGIYHGASLRAWRELFPNAGIVGFDRDPNYFVFEERIRSFYIDQASLPSLMIEPGVTFDLFVDDASHIFEYSLSCYERLKRLVRCFYVIEDIQQADVPRWDALNIDNSWMIEMGHLRPTLTDNNMLVIRM